MVTSDPLPVASKLIEPDAFTGLPGTSMTHVPRRTPSVSGPQVSVCTISVVSPNSFLANPGTLAGTQRRVLTVAPSSVAVSSTSSCFGYPSASYFARMKSRSQNIA